MTSTTPAPSSATATTSVEGPTTNPISQQTEKQFASIVPDDNNRLQLQHTASNLSSHHDMPNVEYVATGDGDEVYNRFTERRKMIITAVLSFCGFLAPVSSTTVLSAVPEVAATFDCDGSII